MVELMQQATGEKAQMFGPTIIGFGSYQYQYASGHGGVAPLLGFSPRKAALSLYVYSGTPQEDVLLQQLGTFKMGKACMYVKKLSDINLTILQQIMQLSLAHTTQVYTRL
ncbi:DUF1801 domain-containing protein [Flavobacterium agricola]|uniref:DUF1801 domain-containing protein n=1 Tax=Flavobacterium agricola TaxID=2870839 RepID=UPI00222326BE|nr:DUF1801 domain-containing protein [Flavobacterium agricola]